MRRLMQQDVPRLQFFGEVLEELRPARRQDDLVVDVTEADDLADDAVGPGGEVDAEIVGHRSEQGYPALAGEEVADRVGGERRRVPVQVVVGREVAGDPRPALPLPQHGVARDPAGTTERHQLMAEEDPGVVVEGRVVLVPVVVLELEVRDRPLAVVDAVRPLTSSGSGRPRSSSTAAIASSDAPRLRAEVSLGQWSPSQASIRPHDSATGAGGLGRRGVIAGGSPITGLAFLGSRRIFGLPR